jgi:hypothetical protein
VVFAADYPFLDIFWSTLIFVAWVIWFWMVITIFADLFSRHDVSGWGKAAWSVFVIILPFLGVLAYLITQGQGMAERRAEAARSSSAAVDDYIRNVAAQDGPADQIAKAKQLLDSGAIDQAEYEQIKRAALA